MNAADLLGIGGGATGADGMIVYDVDHLDKIGDVGGGEGLFDPQQWNRYAYARHGPLLFTDPDGRQIRVTSNPGCTTLPQFCGTGGSTVDLKDVGLRGVGGGATPADGTYVYYVEHLDNTGDVDEGEFTQSAVPTTPPPPGPTPPGPPGPTPPGPEPTRWERAKTLMRCAAGGAERLSLMSGAELLGVPRNYWTESFLGNDAAMLSHLITGPDRLEALGNAVPANTALYIVGRAGTIYEDRAILQRHKTSGSLQVAGFERQAVGTNAFGRTIGAAVKGISQVKIAWDAGAYAGSLVSCGLGWQ